MIEYILLVVNKGKLNLNAFLQSIIIHYVHKKFAISACFVFV